MVRVERGERLEAVVRARHRVAEQLGAAIDHAVAVAVEGDPRRRRRRPVRRDRIAAERERAAVMRERHRRAVERHDERGIAAAPRPEHLRAVALHAAPVEGRTAMRRAWSPSESGRSAPQHGSACSLRHTQSTSARSLLDSLRNHAAPGGSGGGCSTCDRSLTITFGATSSGGEAGIDGWGGGGSARSHAAITHNAPRRRPSARIGASNARRRASIFEVDDTFDQLSLARRNYDHFTIDMAQLRP